MPGVEPAEKPLSLPLGCVEAKASPIIERAELWVQRKINTVRATGHSTLYVRAVMDKGSYSDLHLDNCMGELAICGGGIPIAKNGNTHAIVIVSGLPHEEDHNFIIRHFDTFRSNHGK